MKNIAVLFLVSAMQLALTWAAPQTPPQGSGNFEEVDEIAPYSVIRKAKNYEIRRFMASKWVCVDHVGKTFRSRNQAMMFFDLFDYISGQNSEGAEIKMTAPVSVLTKPNVDSEGNTLYQMCFYIPKIHQDKPPKPAGEGVYIENRPEFEAAASQFGGFMRKQADWIAQMEVLKANLLADKVQDYSFDMFYGSGYDSPFKFTDRRNEIWLVKTE